MRGPEQPDLPDYVRSTGPAQGARHGGWLVSATLTAGVALGAAALAVLTPQGPEPGHDPPAELDRVTPVEPAVAGPADGLDTKLHPVTVDPSADLVDGQVVRVSGTGFPPNRSLGVVTCSGAVELGGGASRCMLGSYTAATSRSDGSFEAEHPVRRWIYVGDRWIDCATPPPEGQRATCAVAAGAIDDYDESGFTLVHFDPEAPLPESPTLHVEPSEGLADNQEVLLRVDGLQGEHGWMTVLLCAERGSQTVSCQGFLDRQLGTGEDLDAALHVRASRYVVSYVYLPDEQDHRPQVLDCADPEVGCYLELMTGEGWRRPLRAHLGFEPSAPAHPSETALLPDGAVPREHGWPESSLAEVLIGSRIPSASLLLQCIAGTETCEPGGTDLYWSVTPLGRVASISIVEVIHDPHSGESFDCRARPGACVIRVAAQGAEPRIDLVLLLS